MKTAIKLVLIDLPHLFILPVYSRYYDVNFIVHTVTFPAKKENKIYKNHRNYLLLRYL